MTTELNDALQNIKAISGVENVILVQKDGLPMASAGVWFSKDEVFAVSSATCAIFSVTRLIHGDFKYLLMESETSKVFLASLPYDPDYFLTVTTAPRVNLAALFIEMRRGLSQISYLLQQHANENLPPLRSFSNEETQRVMRGFSVTDGHESFHSLSRSIISLDRSQSLALRTILRQIKESIPDIESVFLALDGGVRISLDSFSNDRLAAMSFALYDASERVVQTLRNTSLEAVLCETNHLRHLLYSVPKGVFSIWVNKHSQKLGLMRLLLKHYVDEIKRILGTASMKPAIPKDLRDLLLSGSADGKLLLLAREES